MFVKNNGIVACIAYDTLYLRMVPVAQNNDLIAIFLQKFSIVLGIFYKRTCRINDLNALGCDYVVRLAGYAMGSDDQ